MESFDLNRPEFAYFFGLAQTDGHLDGSATTKGRLLINLAKRDEAVLYELVKILPVRATITRRSSVTNFSNSIPFESTALGVFDRRLRAELMDLGLPAGAKSLIVAPPFPPFSERDYWRGVIDGDGSLGITAKGYAFLSLVTSSEAMAAGFIAFAAGLTGVTRQTSRNKRDGVYNIAFFNEDARKLVSVLYYPDALAIPRKVAAAVVVQDWIRPVGMRAHSRKRVWTDAEDRVALEHTPTQSAKILYRSVRSTNIRRWRLHSIAAKERLALEAVVP